MLSRQFLLLFMGLYYVRVLYKFSNAFAFVLIVLQALTQEENCLQS